MLRLFIAVTLGLTGTSASALDCAPLKPTPPQNTDTTFIGKLDASVGGVFAKIAKLGANVEGTYKDVVNNIMPEFPNADRLYMWERVLFLQCQLIAESTTLTDKEKIQFVGKLYLKTGSPPPDTSAARSNSITNSGNNNVILQGTGNNMTTGK